MSSALLQKSDRRWRDRRRLTAAIVGCATIAVLAASAIDCRKRSKELRLTVHDANGQRAVRFRGKSDRVTIELGGGKTVVKGRPTGSGKRHYQVAENVTDVRKIPKESYKSLAKTIRNLKGFKVRDDAGALLWTVRSSAEAIRLAKGDAKEDAYVIRTREKEFVVRRGPKEDSVIIARVANSGKEHEVRNDKNAVIYEGRVGKRAVVLGVLAIAEIPETLRSAIIAELLLPPVKTAAQPDAGKEPEKSGGDAKDEGPE